jgi:hypothetical protein
MAGGERAVLAGSAASSSSAPVINATAIGYDISVGDNALRREVVAREPGVVSNPSDRAVLARLLEESDAGVLRAVLESRALWASKTRALFGSGRFSHPVGYYKSAASKHLWSSPDQSCYPGDPGCSSFMRTSSSLGVIDLDGEFNRATQVRFLRFLSHVVGEDMECRHLSRTARGLHVPVAFPDDVVAAHPVLAFLCGREANGYHSGGTVMGAALRSMADEFDSSMRVVLDKVDAKFGDGKGGVRSDGNFSLRKAPAGRSGTPVVEGDPLSSDGARFVLSPVVADALHPSPVGRGGVAAPIAVFTMEAAARFEEHALRAVADLEKLTSKDLEIARERGLTDVLEEARPGLFGCGASSSGCGVGAQSSSGMAARVRRALDVARGAGVPVEAVESARFLLEESAHNPDVWGDGGASSLGLLERAAVVASARPDLASAVPAALVLCAEWDGGEEESSSSVGVPSTGVDGGTPGGVVAPVGAVLRAPVFDAGVFRDSALGKLESLRRDAEREGRAASMSFTRQRARVVGLGYGAVDALSLARACERLGLARDTSAGGAALGFWDVYASVLSQLHTMSARGRTRVCRLVGSRSYARFLVEDPAAALSSRRRLFRYEPGLRDLDEAQWARLEADAVSGFPDTGVLGGFEESGGTVPRGVVAVYGADRGRLAGLWGRHAPSGSWEDRRSVFFAREGEAGPLFGVHVGDLPSVVYAVLRTAGVVPSSGDAARAKRLAGRARRLDEEALGALSPQSRAVGSADAPLPAAVDDGVEDSAVSRGERDGAAGSDGGRGGAAHPSDEGASGVCRATGKGFGLNRDYSMGLPMVDRIHRKIMGARASRRVKDDALALAVHVCVLTAQGVVSVPTHVAHLADGVVDAAGREAGARRSAVRKAMQLLRGLGVLAVARRQKSPAAGMRGRASAHCVCPGFMDPGGARAAAEFGAVVSLVPSQRSLAGSWGLSWYRGGLMAVPGARTGEAVVVDGAVEELGLAEDRRRMGRFFSELADVVDVLCADGGLSPLRSTCSSAAALLACEDGIRDAVVEALRGGEPLSESGGADLRGAYSHPSLPLVVSVSDPVEWEHATRGGVVRRALAPAFWDSCARKAGAKRRKGRRFDAAALLTGAERGARAAQYLVFTVEATRPVTSGEREECPLLRMIGASGDAARKRGDDGHGMVRTYLSADVVAPKRCDGWASHGARRAVAPHVALQALVESGFSLPMARNSAADALRVGALVERATSEHVFSCRMDDPSTGWGRVCRHDDELDAGECPECLVEAGCGGLHAIRAALSWMRPGDDGRLTPHLIQRFHRRPRPGAAGRARAAQEEWAGAGPLARATAAAMCEHNRSHGMVVVSLALGDSLLHFGAGAEGSGAGSCGRPVSTSRVPSRFHGALSQSGSGAGDASSPRRGHARGETRAQQEARMVLLDHGYGAWSTLARMRRRAPMRT